MADKAKKPVKPVVKPFLTGNPVDEQTWKGALTFFGVLLLVAFMTFMVCGALTMDNIVLRVGLNSMVEVLILLVMFNSATSRGADAVARGEILWQKQEKGQTFAASEKSICFHPAKGYIMALIGTIPFLICAILLAVTTKRQTTSFGTLPGWISAYQGRSDIGNALTAYTQTVGMSVEDVLRIIVRIVLMPFVSMIGGENREGMLTLERLSPVLVLLPALAYGTGYLRGKSVRTQIHTGIAESNTRRARRERKARKARMTQKPRTPEQLN